MSLQVDLQLSLLNISSTSSSNLCNSRGGSNVPLEPETLRNLKEAQESVRHGGLETRYPTTSQKAVESSAKSIQTTSSSRGRSNSRQSEHRPGVHSRATEMPGSTRSGATGSASPPSMNIYSMPQSFMLIPANTSATQSVFETQHVAKSDVNRNGFSLPEVEQVARQVPSQLTSSSTDSSVHMTIASSSLDNFDSARSTQDGQVEVARKIKAVQSVLHASATRF
ncbi:uncharacterized protein RAG0_11504 [Rhynchosporium agropyri]|uniref:Uncharacterized protein n=1 Tax=Rhynchosporium agropyri TaxID=914238 RepID=A0A1E1L4F9_9HELO|nr:uncharacterized protein RAG0_11504 [Rhynchosporium agropyri]